MQRQPFDISAMMEDLDATLVEETYDPTGARAGSQRLPRRDVPLRNSDGPAPRPQNDQAPPAEAANDPINPVHYRKHPSGIECIDITRHMNFNIGNSIKYLWRYLDKGDPVENLKKAQWYIDDEIRRLQGMR